MKQLLTIMMVFVAITGFAQQKTITGTVTGKTGTAMPGVTVQSKKQTAVTDTSGKFSVAAEAGETIRFSYVGMNDISIVVSNTAEPLTVTMEEGNVSLNQVVVVGYTTQRKQDLTGAVAVVEMVPAVKNNTSGNMMQALQGRVAGLYIEKSGSPNGNNSRVLIRGANTLGFTDPLYVIDGIPTTRP